MARPQPQATGNKPKTTPKTTSNPSGIPGGLDPTNPLLQNVTGGVIKFILLVKIALQYGVPWPVLYGVWGQETSFGSNHSTSSAGAMGDFQFIPSTAAIYHYPMVNNPNDQQWGQQAIAAAQLLAHNYKQYGSWDAAVHAYSSGTPTGGYGLSQVTTQANAGLHNRAWAGQAIHDAVTGAKGAVNAVGNAISGAAGAIGSVAGALGSIATLLTSAEFWLRLGEAAAGIILLAMGLRSLTGNTTSPASVAAAAVKYVR